MEWDSQQETETMTCKSRLNVKALSLIFFTFCSSLKLQQTSASNNWSHVFFNFIQCIIWIQDFRAVVEEAGVEFVQAHPKKF